MILDTLKSKYEHLVTFLLAICYATLLMYTEIMHDCSVYLNAMLVVTTTFLVFTPCLLKYIVVSQNIKNVVTCIIAMLALICMYLLFYYRNIITKLYIIDATVDLSSLDNYLRPSTVIILYGSKAVDFYNRLSSKKYAVYLQGVTHINNAVKKFNGSLMRGGRLSGYFYKSIRIYGHEMSQREINTRVFNNELIKLV